jgi:hypothetical protein
MTKDQAIEEAKKIAALIPVTKDSSTINVTVPNEHSPVPSVWIATFKQEAYSKMDDRGFWMDFIRWEFENIVGQN